MGFNKFYLISTRFVEAISHAFSWVAALALAALMLMTGTDVILRYLFNRPIEGGFEISEYLMVTLVALSLGYCTILKRHVTIDILISRFSRRAQAIINSITYLMGLGLFLLITWQCAANTLFMRSYKVTSPSLYIPTYPFVAILTIGVFVLCLAFLLQIIVFIRQGVKK